MAQANEFGKGFYEPDSIGAWLNRKLARLASTSRSLKPAIVVVVLLLVVTHSDYELNLTLPQFSVQLRPSPASPPSGVERSDSSSTAGFERQESQDTKFGWLSTVSGTCAPDSGAGELSSGDR